MLFNLGLCLAILGIYLLTHLGKREKKTKDKLFLLITFVLLFVLIASREMTTGNDTTAYLGFYGKSGDYGWNILGMDNRFEIGYVVFNALLNSLHFSPRAFLCVLAFIFSFVIYKFIKDNSNNYLMSVLMFVNLLFFYQSMNIMRQFLALSIILAFGFRYVKEKKLFRYIFAVMIASLFHTTALIALLIYPMYNMKYSRKAVLLIICGTIIGSLLIGQIYPLVASLIGHEVDYVDTIGEVKLGSFISMLIYLVMYLFAIFVTRKKNQQENSSYLYSLLFAAAVYGVSINMAIIGRAAEYCAIFSIIALPNIIEENIRESKAIVESSIIGLFMLYASIIMINKPEWNSAYNYETCLLPGDNYVCE